MKDLCLSLIHILRHLYIGTHLYSNDFRATFKVIFRTLDSKLASKLDGLSNHHASDLSVPLHSLCFPFKSVAVSRFFFFQHGSILVISLAISHYPYGTHVRTILILTTNLCYLYWYVYSLFSSFLYFLPYPAT